MVRMIRHEFIFVGALKPSVGSHIPKYRYLLIYPFKGRYNEIIEFGHILSFRQIFVAIEETEEF